MFNAWEKFRNFDGTFSYFSSTPYPDQSGVNFTALISKWDGRFEVTVGIDRHEESTEVIFEGKRGSLKAAKDMASITVINHLGLTPVS